jgi:xanthine dehydrogenase YagS FAD-binding subunit
VRPFTIESAPDPASAVRLAGLSEDEDGAAGLPAVRYIAGGTTLVDLMKLGVEQPRRLVDLGPLRHTLGGIEASGAGLRLGALARMSEAADHPAVRRDYPVIAEALRNAASAQLRNMATLGGNVLQRTRCSYFRDPGSGPCNKRNPGSGCGAIGGITRGLAVLGISEHCIANYPGDLAVALAALEAEVTILGKDGVVRVIPFEELHRLPERTPHLETTLRPADLITEFWVPASPWSWRSLYIKARDRESYAFALASVAVAADIAEDGRVRDARIAIGGLATRPWRSHEAEAALHGRRLDEEAAAEAASIALAACTTDAQTAFKPELGRRILAQGLLAAAAMTPPAQRAV